jgi:drug/metabolite transporter (DMT)-like permease
MSERLTASQIVLLLAYAAGMAAGQLLFKGAALRLASPAASAGERILALFQNGYFLAALALYAALAILWVWVLSFTPLSRAYPFVALAFAVTPLLGGLVFDETISLRLVFGVLLILSGLFFVIG